MAIRNTLIDAYGLNSPGKNLLEHSGNHDYSGFYPANQTQNIQINYDNINNYIHITQNSDSRVGIYRAVNNIEPGKIYNLSFYVYSEYSGTFRNCFETSTEEYGSNLTFNSNEWNKCWVTSKAGSKNIVFYVQNTSFKIRNIKLTECTKKDCYFFQYTDINDELKPFVYNFKDLQTNCRYTEYFTNDNPINELISWENFKYPLKEFVKYEEWQYSNDKSYRTRNTTSIIDWCDGSNKSSVSNTEREDATIEYGTPELTLVVDDIPASGGTISNGTVSYGQSKYYVYSDTRFKVTDESGVITEGLTWGDPVTAQSLGTTIKDRSIVGTLSVSTTINGKTESTTVDVYQQANKIESYGIPAGRTLSVSDIPASGGTISRGTLGGTITQSCTYTSGSNGTLTNPTITSSSYSSSITADSLGTTIKDRTKIGTLTYTYVCNKRTGSVSADVYQQANEATDITYGDWSVSLSANKYTTSSSPAPAGGGTAAITSSASRSRIQNYTSGATSKLSNETASPSLSVTGSGFSLSGTTVTVNNRSNVEGGQRTASVTATISGVTKSITLYQALNKITSITATGSASSYTVMNISAGGGTVTWTPTITYSSGWSGNPPSGVTISYSSSESAAIQSGNVTTWPSRGITIGPWIGSDITISAKSAYTTKAVTGVVTTGQNLNTINDISITNGSGSTPVTSVSASGGTVEIFPRLSFSSGEYQFVLDYSKLGSWSGTGTGFTVSDITASSSTGRRIVAASRGTTIGVDRSITSTYTLNTTINGIAINKSATHKCTQAGNYVESISISGGTFSYNNISASATSASPTITGSSVYFNFTSGSKSGTAPSSTYGTYSSSASYTLESVINGFTSVSQYSGTLTSTNRGTTIGNARTSGVVTRKITVTWTPTSNYNSAGTKTDSLSLTATCTQNGNYVTSINVVGTSFQYDNIGAGNTSAYPESFSGGSVTYNFSSGSTSTTAPSSTYGSYSVVTTYSLGSVINGFTAVDEKTGVLTATNRGTTIGNARTSGVVTRTLVGTWTPSASYNAEGVKTWSGSSTATCTQALNTITSIALYMSGPTPSTPMTDYPASGMSSGYVGIPTYSSGASGRIQNLVDYVSYSFSESWGRWEMSQDGYWGNLFVNTRGTVEGEARSGKLTCTIAGTINGVSVNVSGNLTITQAANAATTITYGPWVVSVSSNKYASSSAACPASGGSATITRSASRTRTQNYTSGATSPLSAETATPTLSISGAGFSLIGTTVTVASRGTTIGAARTATVTATYSGVSKSITLYQALNKVVSCTETNNTLSYPSIAAGGGTSTPSGMTTAQFKYSSGASGDPEGYVWTKSFSMTSGNGFSINTSSGVVTATNNTTTSSRTSNTITRTAKISYTNPASVGGDTVSTTLTKTATCTQLSGDKTYSNPVVSLSYAVIPAKGGTVTPTLSYSQTWGWNGATSGGGTITSGATVRYSGTSVNTTSGVVSASSKGTAISNATTLTTATATVTLNGKSGTKSATIQQAGNYVTSLSIVASSLSYAGISAGATSATPTLSGGSITFTYSSGSTSGDAPSSIYGTLTTTRKYTLGSVINGFTAVNSSTGVLTATNRGTTIGPARTSGTVTYTVTRTWTPTSSYNAAGTKTDTDSKTATCTQALNKMTSITEVNSNVTYSPTTLSAGGGNSTPSYTGNCKLTFSSGASTTYQPSGWSGMEISRSWSLSSTTGFSINTNSGVVTAAYRGTTIGAARSTIANAKLTFSYTNPSTVGGDTVTGTGTDNITITQSENTVTSSKIVPMSGSASDVNFPASGASKGFIGELTLSSGAKIQGADYKNYITYSLTSSFGTFTPNAEKHYGIVTVASRGATIGVQKSGTLTHKISGTINGVSINKTATLGLTQAVNTITSFKFVNSLAEDPTTSFTAAGGHGPYYPYFTWSSGSVGYSKTALSKDMVYTISGSGFRLGYEIDAASSYGIAVVADSRGATIGPARNGVVTGTLNTTINGVTINKSLSQNLTQSLNKITTLAIIPSAGATDTTSYPTGNFAASGGTKTPTTSSRVDATFSSGSHGYTGASGAWYGGTLTISRTWSMATATGFSMNTSNGVVTAASRGTTVGAARTCNPKCVISASFTNPSSVGGGVVKASSITDSFTLTQAANSMTREYSNLVGHISSTTWANKANYTSFWATGDYTERYTSGATGTSGSGSVPWDSVTFGGADWVYYDSVQGILKWYDNTGLERSTTITGRIGSWTYSVKVTQKAGMTIGRLYLHVPVNIGYVEYWNIYVNSTSGGQIWSGNPEQYGSANNILKMPEECAIIVAQNGGTVSFSTTYSTATDRNYRGSISGTEQDRLANGEDVTVYLT